MSQPGSGRGHIYSQHLEVQGQPGLKSKFQNSKATQKHPVLKTK